MQGAYLHQAKLPQGPDYSIGPDRACDVLEVLLAQIGELNAYLALDLIVGSRGDADAAGFRDALKPRGDHAPTDPSWPVPAADRARRFQIATENIAHLMLSFFGFLGSSGCSGDSAWVDNAKQCFLGHCSIPLEEGGSATGVLITDGGH